MEKRGPEQEPQHPQGGGPVGAGCGFLLGLLFALYLAFRVATEETAAMVILVLLPLAFAWLTYKYGDRFFGGTLEGFRNWPWWWW